MDQKFTANEPAPYVKVRPTILGLMGVIAFVAVWMAAVRSGNNLLTLVVFAVGLCLCSAYSGIGRTRPAKLR